MRKQKLKAVFFDMDGVLYDSMQFHERSWIEAFREVGISFNPIDAYMNEGRTGRSTICNTYLKHSGIVPDNDLIDKIYANKTKIMTSFGRMCVVEKMPQIVTTLTQKGLQLWVVTGSAQRTLLERVCEDYNYYFHPQRMVTALDVKHGKPNPEPYLMALQKSGFQASQCIVIENAPLGIRSAVGAGIVTLAINTGILEDEILKSEGAAFVTKSIEELHRFILENFEF